MSLPGEGRPRRVGVLDRTLAILDAVGSGPLTFTEIVATTGLTRPTTHRLVKALQAQRLLVEIGGRRYALGPRLIRLAATALRDLPLREVAHPALERLARATGESAQLYVRNGDRRVCVDAVEAASELRTIVPIGAELPLTAGSAGKVFLAAVTERDRERLLRRPPRFTTDTLSPDALRGEVRDIDRRGWASSRGEREPGVASVSAPVWDPDGGLVAVVSVSGPHAREGSFPARRYASAVVEAAREIGEALGYPSGDVGPSGSG